MASSSGNTGPSGDQSGTTSAPSDPSSNNGASVVRPLSPSNSGNSVPPGGPTGGGNQPALGEVATVPPVAPASGSFEGRFAFAGFEVNFFGPVAPAATVGNAGNGAGVAANATPAGKVVLRDGRPVFDGRIGGPSTSDLARSILDGRSDSDEVDPLDPVTSASIHGAGSGSEADGLSMDQANGRLDVPSPQRSDLLTDFKPLDRTSLEHAIDQFLRPFEDLGAGLSRFRWSDDLLTDALALAVALSASQVVLRSLMRFEEDEAALAGTDVIASLDEFSGLSDPWDLEET